LPTATLHIVVINSLHSTEVKCSFFWLYESDRATVEAHQNLPSEKLPPVTVTVASNDVDFIIKYVTTVYCVGQKNCAQDNVATDLREVASYGAGLAINWSWVQIPAAMLPSTTLGKLFTNMPVSEQYNLVPTNGR